MPTRSVWLPSFWIAAAILPTLFYAFEAGMISAYPATRAPNVNLMTQLAMMFAFYGAWIVVPRVIWTRSTRILANDSTIQPQLAGQLLITGLILCSIHLLALTFILRVMHSPPGWGISHFLHSFGEVWLSKGMIWMLAYGATAAAIVARLARKPASPPAVTRLEIRQNGKTLLIPLQEILWIKAAGNYVEVFTGRGMHMLRKPLSKLEHDLDGSTFIKSHRGALVNSEHVTAIQSGGKGEGYIVKVGDETEAPLSRRRLAEFKKIISQSNSRLH